MIIIHLCMYLYHTLGVDILAVIPHCSFYSPSQVLGSLHTPRLLSSLQKRICS